MSILCSRKVFGDIFSNNGDYFIGISRPAVHIGDSILEMWGSWDPSIPPYELTFLTCPNNVC